MGAAGTAGQDQTHVPNNRSRRSGLPKPVPKPLPRKGPQPGDRVNVEIVANDNAQVTVKVLDGQGEEVRFRQSYYPGQPGEKRKMKVRAVDAQGKITQVAP